MLVEILPLLILGFSLGLVHALDADHVMAVSALSNQKPNFIRTLSFSAHWALGHGGVLLVSGLLLFGLGISIPSEFQYVAELSVGFMLIGIGLYTFWQFKEKSISVTHHVHGDIEHSHWHDKKHTDKNIEKSEHVPVMVGCLHGLAGSAPALALIPIASQGNISTVIGYLFVFSSGVMLSMVLFGLGLGSAQKWLSTRFKRVHYWSQRFIALASTVVGFLWLYKAI